MKVAITGCGTLEQGKLITEDSFFTIYPELRAYQEKIELLAEAPTPTTPIVSNTEEHTGKHNLKKSSVISPKSSVILYTKHFIVIQNGCDNYCSFCLTVLKRGQHRSRPLTDIITEIQTIEAQGVKEIVLTGINLAARGTTNTRNPSETQFPSLLEAILQQTSIPRIRISSIGPEYVNDQFFEILTDERILPHFHYSIQSFSDNVLQKMKRNYTADQLTTTLKRTRKLQRPQSSLISLGADIIVGFPGETESDFLETLKGIEEYGITKLHAFPFSDHHKGETIPASRYLDQIPPEVKKERESRLLEV
jgi:MiaB/RimO family radical SAM methylthiotransferase